MPYLPPEQEQETPMPMWRVQGMWIFNLAAVIGGVAGREAFGLWVGLAIAGGCILVSVLLRGPEKI